MQQLRPYQSAVTDPDGPVKQAMRRGARNILLSSPCGSGKTTIISDITARSVSNGLKVNILAHRRKLIQQIAERLAQFGIDYNIEMATLPEQDWVKVNKSASVNVCSRDTILARKDRDGVPVCDVLIVDECHVSPNSVKQIHAAMQAKYCFGFTATPCNSDGSGLSRKFWQELIGITTIEHLIANKWLSPLDVYAPPGVADRRKRGLDVKVSGDPIEMWKQHATGLPTVVFCNTVAESIRICEQYCKAGIDAAHVDASNNDDERVEIFNAFQSGQITVLCNVGIVGVGVDIPEIECVQLLTKCQSPIAMWQLTGRAARTCTHRGKSRGVILDHAASYAQHGHPNVSPIWTLDEGDSVQNRQINRKEKDPEQYEPVVCPSCGMVNIGAGRCANCNAKLFRRKSEPMQHEREGLSLVTDGNLSPNDPRQQAWRQMLYMGARAGFNYAKLSAMFKGRFGIYPSDTGVYPQADFLQRSELIVELFPEFGAKVRKR